MADTKISGLTEITSIDQANDFIEVLDTSDTTMAGTGTNKKIKPQNLGFGSGTVTSVAQTVPTGFTVSGTPITTSGTLAIAYDTGYQGFLTSDKTKLDGIETGADVTDATNVNAAGATMNTDTSLIGNSYFLDEDDMISDSNAKVPSQQSVKAYVDALTIVIGIACSDETTDLAVSTAATTFRMPHNMTLKEVRATVTTAPVGSAITVDINESGTSILSTKITIDATEKTSETAATPPVLSDTVLADDAEITVDIDAVGSTTAGAGLKIWLIGER